MKIGQKQVVISPMPGDARGDDTSAAGGAKPGDTICCTGSLTYQRGITHLIRAAHQAGVKLILAGQYSSEEYRRELEAMPEYSCVEYLGYIGRQELAQVYARSSIGMSTILNVGQYASLDNFPTKVYEYMAGRSAGHRVRLSLHAPQRAAG